MPKKPKEKIIKPKRKPQIERKEEPLTYPHPDPEHKVYRIDSRNLRGKFKGIFIDAVNQDFCIKIGDYYLWIDSTGDLRIKSSEPTTDTDGSVVGGQS